MSHETLKKIKTVAQFDKIIKSDLFRGRKNQIVDSNALYLLGRVMAIIALEQAYYAKNTTLKPARGVYDGDIDFCRAAKKCYAVNGRYFDFGRPGHAEILAALATHPRLVTGSTLILRRYLFQGCGDNHEPMHYYGGMIDHFEEETLIHVKSELIKAGFDFHIMNFRDSDEH